MGDALVEAGSEFTPAKMEAIRKWSKGEESTPDNVRFPKGLEFCGAQLRI